MKFLYRAKKGPNDIQEGQIEAANYRAAVDEVSRLGMTPLDVSPLEKGLEKTRASSGHPNFISSLSSLWEKIFPRDVVLLTRYLADFLGAGVPMLRSLQLTQKYFLNGRMEDVLDDIVKSVQGGEALSAAMSRSPSVFSEAYVNMIYAGEMSGSLEETMERLAGFLEKDQESRAKILSSFIYPSLIAVVGIATIFILFTWIIPEIMPVFDELDQEIPLITQALMGISVFFSMFWWLIVLIAVVALFIFIRWYRSSDGRAAVDKKLFMMPGVGLFIRQISVARFTRILGTLIRGGVDIVPALGYASQVVSNRHLQAQFKQIIDYVAGGMPLSRAIAKGSIFTEADISMLSVGEETGSLSTGLFKLADFYEKSNDRIIKVITTMIEPAFILALGLVISFVVLAIAMPIFQMNLVAG